MSVAFLDINDCNLQLWHDRGRLQSPGYALLEGRDYRFGGPARGAARLRPRDINTRYWWQLSTEPLQPALGPARHSADLVHSHLLALHKDAGAPGELLLATSGSMDREQLSLLLGIAGQCPFDVVGLVNRSTLISSLHGDVDRLFHLELQLHQALLSEMATSGSDISLTRATPLPGCGLLQLQDQLVEVLAAGFIRQTRFDPRRKAATEQELYDSLPAALQALAHSGETNIEINGYRARVTRRELEGVGKRLLQSAAQSMDSTSAQDTLLIDPLAGLLPGITDAFDQSRVITAEAQWLAVQEHGERLLSRGKPLAFTTTLPCLHRNNETPIAAAYAEPMPEPAPAVANVPTATHLLTGHCATALNNSGTELENGAQLYLDTQGWRIRAGNSFTVNGQNCPEEHLLVAGDILQSPAGTEFRLIAVIAPGA